MPMATPEASSSGSWRRMAPKGTICRVSSSQAPISTAANTARYKASSPDDTEMHRTKGASVPKMAIDRII